MLDIGYDEPLEWHEITEIVQIIDDFVKGDSRFRHWRYDEIIGFEYRNYNSSIPPDIKQRVFESTSVVKVERVQSGSALLFLVIGGVLSYPIWAFGMGIRRSRLGEEMERLGRNAGNIAADGLESINQRLEDWSQNNSKIRGKKTSPKLTLIEYCKPDEIDED